MTIVSPHDVRLVSDLDEDDISDNKLIELIQYGWEQVITDIGKREVEEEVNYIDSYRKNIIDGTTTSFYVQNSFTRFLGDMDFNQTLDTGDAQLYLYDVDLNRTEATVSAVDETGLITLDAAVEAGTKLTITYVHLPVPISHNLMKRACIYLTAAMAYGKLEARDYKSVGFRGLSITRMAQGFNSFYQKYQTIIQELLGYDSIIGRFDDDQDTAWIQPIQNYKEPRRS